MDAIQNIMSRISVRQYSDRETSEEALRTILEAGMAGPSCVNAREWSFIVVRDRKMLNCLAFLIPGSPTPSSPSDIPRKSAPGRG